MPTYKFTDPKAHASKVAGDAERRRGRMIAAIRDAVMQGMAIVQEEVDRTTPYPPVDRGTYRRGFQYAQTPAGATIYNHVPYQGVLEDGRRPGTGVSRAGQKAIAAWVLRKGLITKSVPRGDRQKAAERVAFLIARKIQARGQPGKHVFARAMTRIEPIVEAAVERAIRTP